MSQPYISIYPLPVWLPSQSDHHSALSSFLCYCEILANSPFSFQMNSYWEHQSTMWTKEMCCSWSRMEGSSGSLTFSYPRWGSPWVQDHQHCVLIAVWVLNPKSGSFHLFPLCFPSLPFAMLKRDFYLKGIWLGVISSLFHQPYL